MITSKQIMKIKNIKIAILMLALVGMGLGYILLSSNPKHVETEHAQNEEHGDEHDAEKEGAHDGETKEEHGDKHGEEGAADSVNIEAKSAEAAGIKVETAGSGVVSERITLSGRVTLNQSTTARLKARFPGMVREVTKGEGEAVQKGDVLASIESNDSLQTYTVKSPISGVVIARNTNMGDVAGEEALFTITDTTMLWAEFHVFPRDIDRIKIGQKVLITSFEGGHTTEAEITTLLPITETSSQTTVARVTIQNPDGLWRAGMTVRGDVVIAEHKAPLVIKTSALQRMENRDAVFVKKGDTQYETRPVKIGASNNEWTAILSGLEVSELYVSEKSFQVKADVGKAGAAHEH